MSLTLRVCTPGERPRKLKTEARTQIRATREAGALAQQAPIGTRIEVLRGAGWFSSGTVISVVERRL